MSDRPLFLMLCAELGAIVCLLGTIGLGFFLGSIDLVVGSSLFLFTALGVHAVVRRRLAVKYGLFR